MSGKRYRLADGRYLYEVKPGLFQLQNEFQKAVTHISSEAVELPAALETEAEKCQSTQESDQAL